MTKSKYHNRKVVRDGMVFASVKEYHRWLELKMLERAGKITELQRQVPFLLIPTQRGEVWSDKKHKFVSRVVERSCSYVADFVYLDDKCSRVVEDAKGLRTKEYIIKRKLMLERHGIRIREV